MKKLFFTRLLLWYTALFVPIYHPAVAVSYDRIGWILWFALVPLMMAESFFLKPPKVKFIHSLMIPAVSVVLFSLLLSNLTRTGWLILAAMSFAWIWTRLVFSKTGRTPALASLELFLLGTIYLKILTFTRASEEIANISARHTIIVMVLFLLTFLLHGAVIYLAAFPDRTAGRKRKELIALALILVPLAGAIAYLTPLNFVKNDIVLNRLNEEPPPQPKEITDGAGKDKSSGQEDDSNTRNGKPLGERREKYPSELQGGKDQQKGENQEPTETRPDEHRQGGGTQNKEGSGKERQKQNQSESGKNNKLHGVPADQWDKMNQNQQGGSSGRQKAVMVIASPLSPIYAAEAFLGTLDPKKGFLVSKDEPLNDLTYRRLAKTWKNQSPDLSTHRKSVDIFYLSTIPERVAAYDPESVEPTVLDKDYHPFDFNYRVRSAVSIGTPEDWRELRDFTDEEKNFIKNYLDVPLDANIRSRFQNYLRPVLKGKKDHFEKVEAILKSFSTYQYELGFDEDTSIIRLDDFLYVTKRGDCTEFANTTALLARLAGVPARVVHGFIASKDLQTPAHRKGIKVLRRTLAPLRQYPESQLYLVTDAHHHAWVQFYFPEYGWIDFETTSFARPPRPEMDANNKDVLIPLVEEKERIQPKKFEFPWRLVFKASAAVALLIILLLYLFRYGRELYLWMRSFKDSPDALRSLEKLFYMRLATNGYVLKLPHHTPLDYYKENRQFSNYPLMLRFIHLYTMLRYKENFAAGERERLLKDTRLSYRDAVRSLRKPGIFNFFRRILSLRGLYY